MLNFTLPIFREGNIFSVRTNVPATEKLTFHLTYEQLLRRKLSQYEHAVNINPGQAVEDLEVIVRINESLPLIKLKVPEMRLRNELVEEEIAKSDVKISMTYSNTAIITYKPSLKEQENYGFRGISGEFIVQYDVDRKNQHSDIQVCSRVGNFSRIFFNQNI